MGEAAMGGAPAMKSMKAMKAAMKAMKVMKAIKAMKVMKAMKAMKGSKIARGKRARSQVFSGLKEKTTGGLTKEQLMKNKFGKVVNKAASARAKKRYASSGLRKFAEAVKAARKQLGIVGFCAVNGKTAQGKALYAKAKAILGK